MASVELTTDQVLRLVRQLPPQHKLEVLFALAGDSQLDQDSRLAYAEQQLRSISAKRGFIWDTLTEDEREAFADDLVHEDRACNQ